MTLKDIDTKALRAELAKRDAKQRKQQQGALWKAIQAEYGVCKAEFGVTNHEFVVRSDEPFPEGPCGEEFNSYEMEEIRPILMSPPNWPLLAGTPPLESAITVGSEQLITLTCRRGHKTEFERTVFYDKPIEPLF